MRIALGVIAFLIIAAILGGAFVSIRGIQTYRGPGPLEEPVFLLVEKGDSVNAVAEKLLYEGIIGDMEDEIVFKIAARLSGADTKIKAGEYRFAPGVSMEAVLGKLVAGDIYLRQITIPEGLTSWQVVQLVNAHDDLEGPPVTAIPPEGSLLPETFSFARGDTRQDLISRMQDDMGAVLDSLWEGRAENLPLQTKEDALTLASIVEKETGVPEERRRVAGVFINRLRAGIALQTDPTVIYALTKGEIQDNGQGPLGRRLLKKDLEVDSPYNTYKYPGLPPGPIANPGKAAVEAVLHPEDHEFLYFVADGSGGHVFSRTLAEHNANVARWRKIRSQNKK